MENYPLWILQDRCLSRRSDFFLAAEKFFYDELLRQGQQPILIYLWETIHPALVLGIGQDSRQEVYLDRARGEGVPVLRRRSGGGTVVHAPGNLCYSLFLPLSWDVALREVVSSFFYVGSWVSRALEELAVCARVVPLSDIAVCHPEEPTTMRKVSGNAQWRRRHYLLQHGTLLFQYDPLLWERLLQEPLKQPDYRQKRRHREFVLPLERFDVTVERWLPSFRRVLLQEWEKKSGRKPRENFFDVLLMDDDSSSAVQLFATDHYGALEKMTLDLYGQQESIDLSVWHCDHSS